MIKYYYQVLILITLLFFVPKTQRIGNKNIKIYHLSFLNKNDLEKSNKDQKKTKQNQIKEDNWMKKNQLEYLLI